MNRREKWQSSSTPGHSAVVAQAESLRDTHRFDALVINAENASDGAGLMPRQYKRLINAGVDAMTMGDHLYRRAEIIPIVQKSDRIVRPANYPGSSTGKRWTIVESDDDGRAVSIERFEQRLDS